MAHSRSARKNIRKNRKGNNTNRARKHVLKTATKRLLTTIEAKTTAEAETVFKALQAKLDKTAQTGTIHKNKAARTKSRMQKRLNALKKAAKA